MVTPLMKQAADEPGRDGHARLGYAAAWGPGAARVVQARRAVRAVLSHLPHAGRASVPESRVVDAPPDGSRVGGHGLHLHAVSDHLAVTPRSGGKEITARVRLAAGDDAPVGRTVLSASLSGRSGQIS